MRSEPDSWTWAGGQPDHCRLQRYLALKGESGRAVVLLKANGLRIEEAGPENQIL